jgi:hypothetical protein
MPPEDLNLPQKRDLHAKPSRYHFLKHLEPSYEVFERQNCHGVFGMCRGETVAKAPSRATMEELTAPVGGNMTCSGDRNTRSRTR